MLFARSPDHSYGNHDWNGGRAPGESLSSMGGSDGGRGTRKAPAAPPSKGPVYAPDPVLGPGATTPDGPVLQPQQPSPDPHQPTTPIPDPTDPTKPLDPVIDKSRRLVGSRLTLDVMRQRDIRPVNDRNTSNQSTATSRSDIDPRDNRNVCKARPEDNKPSGGAGSYRRMVFVPWCDRK